MKILIGTRNSGKVEGTKLAFEKFFDDVSVEGIPVESEVNDQPINDEIILGARNRVKNLVKYAEEKNEEVDFFVSIESGMTNKFGNWCIIQIAIIRDKDGYESFGTSPAFPVPKKYVEDIKQNSLGIVMDKLFEGDGLRNSKGGIALLSKDVITRIDMTKDAFIMALTEHINGDLWR